MNASGKGKKGEHMEKMWTVKEVANYFNVSESGVRKWVRTNVIDCVRIQSRVRFTDSQVKDFASRSMGERA